MSMRAVSNGDTILIMRDPQHCVEPNKPVAAFHPDSSTLEVHSGFANYLENILDALRTHQKEWHKPATPVKVEYW